jgi:hypothetical protein
MWPKCPKCRKRNVELIEVWDATIVWVPNDPQFNEGLLNPGDAQKVEGHCIDCEHRWTFRGIIQVKAEWFDD